MSGVSPRQELAAILPHVPPSVACEASVVAGAAATGAVSVGLIVAPGTTVARRARSTVAWEVRWVGAPQVRVAPSTRTSVATIGGGVARVAKHLAQVVCHRVRADHAWGEVVVGGCGPASRKIRRQASVELGDCDEHVGGWAMLDARSSARRRSSRLHRWLRGCRRRLWGRSTWRRM